MQAIGITKIEIDGAGRLLVYPVTQSDDFDYVYRAGAEVNWDSAGYFYSPVPREWSYSKWLEQIGSAVLGELGVQLVARPSTQYVSVPEQDEVAMRAVLARQA